MLIGKKVSCQLKSIKLHTSRADISRPQSQRPEVHRFIAAGGRGKLMFCSEKMTAESLEMYCKYTQAVIFICAVAQNS